jgi:hypothetical protein
VIRFAMDHALFMVGGSRPRSNEMMTMMMMMMMMMMKQKKG